MGVNGVPLRRVSQRFVIVTSTKLDVSSLSGLDDVEDAYFKKSKSAKSKSKDKKEKQKLPENKKKTQLGIDNQLLEVITKTELMKQYLTSYFTIVPGQPPHCITRGKNSCSVNWVSWRMSSMGPKLDSTFFWMSLFMAWTSMLLLASNTFNSFMTQVMLPILASMWCFCSASFSTSLSPRSRLSPAALL